MPTLTAAIVTEETRKAALPWQRHVETTDLQCAHQRLSGGRRGSGNVSHTFAAAAQVFDCEMKVGTTHEFQGENEFVHHGLNNCNSVELHSQKHLQNDISWKQGATRNISTVRYFLSLTILFLWKWASAVGDKELW